MRAFSGHQPSTVSPWPEKSFSLAHDFNTLSRSVPCPCDTLVNRPWFLAMDPTKADQQAAGISEPKLSFMDFVLSDVCIQAGKNWLKLLYDLCPTFFQRWIVNFPERYKGSLPPIVPAVYLLVHMS